MAITAAMPGPIGPGLDRSARISAERRCRSDRHRGASRTGVGFGLGQVIMMARNTFNPGLVFFTIVVIGSLGFTFDLLMRLIQRRILYWLPNGVGGFVDV